MSLMDETFGKSRLAKVFAVAMILVGIYAAIRHGGELAYALGKFVGSH